jgi:tetratricopeptide (TPR) repeat protein
VLDELAARFGEARDEVVARQVARGLWERARVWDELAMPELRIAALTELGDRFGLATDQHTANLVTRSLSFRGFALHRAGDVDQAEPLYDEMLRRARGATDPVVREAAMHATVHKAEILAFRGLPEKAIGLLDEQVDELADLIPDHPDYLAFVLVGKWTILREAGPDVELIRVLDDFVPRFEDSADPIVRSQVAGALVEKLDTLGRLHRDAEVAPVFDHLLALFGEEAVEVLDHHINVAPTLVQWTRETLARKRLLRALLLHELGRIEESAEAFDAVIEDFGDDSDPAIATIVEAAQGMRADEP